MQNTYKHGIKHISNYTSSWH